MEQTRLHAVSGNRTRHLVKLRRRSSASAFYYQHFARYIRDFDETKYGQVCLHKDKLLGLYGPADMTGRIIVGTEQDRRSSSCARKNVISLERSSIFYRKSTETFSATAWNYGWNIIHRCIAENT